MEEGRIVFRTLIARSTANIPLGKYWVRCEYNISIILREIGVIIRNRIYSV